MLTAAGDREHPAGKRWESVEESRADSGSSAHMIGALPNGLAFYCARNMLTPGREVQAEWTGTQAPTAL
jgi:hypothetical protein